MLTSQWLPAGAALLVAAVALAMARRVSKRLTKLTESHLDLWYEHRQLQSRVAPSEPAATGHEPRPHAAAPQAAGTAFVPLSSLKRQ